jgi:hypothetical protein
MIGRRIPSPAKIREVATSSNQLQEKMVQNSAERVRTKHSFRNLKFKKIILRKDSTEDGLNPSKNYFKTR